MLLITPADDFIGPDEEHSGQKAGVVLEAGPEGVFLIDLKLLLWLFLLHNKNLLNPTNNQSSPPVSPTTII
jgi:hypothetical protein